MSLAVAFEALGAKLEEEGLVTPTTEAEVSASVTITPEEQTVIDEELSQQEAITEAITEAQTAIDESEQAADAEATMSAIVYSIKKYNGVSPQMYAFLQHSGYLDVIARYQSSSLNKVTYPGVEDLSSANTKDVATQLLAGCEGVLGTIKEGARKFFNRAWEIVTNLWERVIEFAKRFTAMGRLNRAAERIEALGRDYDAEAVKNAKYTGYSKSEVVGAQDFLSGVDKADAVIRMLVEAANNKSKLNDASFKNDVSTYLDGAVQKYKDVKESKRKDVKTLGDANLTVDDLKKSGIFFAISRTMTSKMDVYQKALRTAKSMLAASKRSTFMDSYFGSKDNAETGQQGDKSAAQEYRAALTKYIQYVSAVLSIVTSAASNYVSACDAAVSAAKKAKKASEKDSK